MAKKKKPIRKQPLPEIPDETFRINSRCKPLVKKYWEWVAAGRPMRPVEEQRAV